MGAAFLGVLAVVVVELSLLRVRWELPSKTVQASSSSRRSYLRSVIWAEYAIVTCTTLFAVFLLASGWGDEPLWQNVVGALLAGVLMTWAWWRVVVATRRWQAQLRADSPRTAR